MNKVNNDFIRCENEHYYNSSKYKSCPYCIKYADEIKARHSSVIVFETPVPASQMESSNKNWLNKNKAGMQKDHSNQNYSATEIITEDDK